MAALSSTKTPAKKKKNSNQQDQKTQKKEKPRNLTLKRPKPSTQYTKLEISKPRYAIQNPQLQQTTTTKPISATHTEPHSNHTPRPQQPNHKPSSRVEVREEEHQPFQHRDPH